MEKTSSNKQNSTWSERRGTPKHDFHALSGKGRVRSIKNGFDTQKTGF